MFGIIADVLSSILTILLPAYLSYKALRTSDPAQSTPWLIYFIILSLALLFESWTLFIIGWVPFYSWFRLFFLLYLVLPQTQGAKFLYLNYVEPFIVQHEQDIDVFIGETHQKLEEMGLGYLNWAIDLVRDKVLGQTAPTGKADTANVGVAGYATNLLSRFAMPTATNANAATNIYGMLSGVAGAAMGGVSTLSAGRSRDIPSLAVHGTTPEERSRNLAVEREKLIVLLQSLDKEQQSLDLAYGESSNNSHRHHHSGDRSRSRPSSSGSNLGPSGLKSKSRSELSFDRVEYDDLQNESHHLTDTTPSPPRPHQRTASSSSWLPSMGGWLGGSSPPTAATSSNQKAHDSQRSVSGSSRKTGSRNWSGAMDMTDAIHGSSSGVDLNRDR